MGKKTKKTKHTEMSMASQVVGGMALAVAVGLMAIPCFGLVFDSSRISQWVSSFQTRSDSRAPASMTGEEISTHVRNRADYM